MPRPHIHKEVILAFADGAQVQVKLKGGDHWKDCAYPDFDLTLEYRIKPESAAPKWPQTTMKKDDILSAWYSGSNVVGHVAETLAMYRVANAALAHACESGALVPADKVREIEAKAYEEGVKEGSERGLDKAIRATLNHVNFAVDGIGWMKIRSEAKK